MWKYLSLTLSFLKQKNRPSEPKLNKKPKLQELIKA